MGHNLKGGDVETLSVDGVLSVVSSGVSSGPSPDGSSTQPSPEQAVIWAHSDSCSSSPPSEVSESWQSATSSHLDKNS